MGVFGLPLQETFLLRVFVCAHIYLYICCPVVAEATGGFLRGAVTMETGPSQCCVTRARLQAWYDGCVCVCVRVRERPVTSGDRGDLGKD